MQAGKLYVGASVPPVGGTSAPYHIDSSDLSTHGVLLGMTGSGKSAFAMVLVESAAQQGIPSILIDVKGDLPNLMLAFPTFAADAMLPWMDHEALANGQAGEHAAQRALERQKHLGAWGIDQAQLERYFRRTEVRVLTPGSSQGEPLHILSSLERRQALWESDADAARASLSAAISLVLRLLGLDPDPAKSRAHVLLSVLAEARLRAGKHAELGALMGEVLIPPLERIGELAVDDFMSSKERASLASALNTLIASPSFASWRQGASLDVKEWLTPKHGRTPIVVISVAHLDDEERTLVLGVILEEILAYTRSLRGTQRLRALVVFDEVYGLIPPYPHNPPTKRPTVLLMKTGRAYGVSVIVASQNPMDLDYRTLSNAGYWAVGRLQTDADRARVVESIANANEPGATARELHDLLRKLGKRWFVVRNAHASPSTCLVQPRWAMSFLRGPMTLGDIRQAREQRTAQQSAFTSHTT
jgi:Helicase HerA, central domain